MHDEMYHRDNKRCHSRMTAVASLHILLLSLALTGTATAQSRPTLPDSARITYSDIANFWRAYDRLAPALTRADSVAVLNGQYLAHATAGLNSYLETHLKKADNLLMALGLLPKYLAAVRTNTLRLQQDEATVRAALRRVEAFYPAATYPD